MAARLIEDKVRAKLLSCKLSIHCESEDEENILKHLFKEFDSLTEGIIEKQRNSEVKEYNVLVDSWQMVKRMLCRLHEAIIKRLRSTPSLSNPWRSVFQKDIPVEVFDIIWKIIKRNGFGHETFETKAKVNISIYDMRKAVYLFNYLNKDGVITEKCMLLKKDFKNGECASVIVSRDKPFCIHYNKNSEVLSISFSYGVWNHNGIPQH